MSIDIIPGLLIEGVDYAGKSAVAEALAPLLKSRFGEVCHRQCFLSNQPVIEGLLGIARQSDSMEQRDICYTAAILIDVGLPSMQDRSGFLIQERHVQTQIARNSFFYEDQIKWHVDELRRLRLPFSQQVYLTSDILAKRQRTSSRPPKSPRDALLAGDCDLHQRFDDFMRETLPAGEPWLVIDTSAMTPAEIARLIMGHVGKGEAIVSHKIRV